MDSRKFLVALILISINQASAALKPSYESWNVDHIEIQPRIVNGTDAKIQEFPFMFSLQRIEINETIGQNDSIHSCGGSILNSRWFLTAAHCVHLSIAEKWLVEYATSEISSGPYGEKIAYVEEIHWHENYNSTTLANDIAVGKVKTPFEINILGWRQRLPMPYQYFQTGTPAVLAGWGQLGTGLSMSTVLQRVDYFLYSQRDCSKIHREGDILPENICGGFPGGWKGQCGGDSGGPLMVEGVQVGIVSWSIKPCTVPPYPGVFTNVAFYIDWIEEKIGQTLKTRSYLQARDLQEIA